MHTKESPFRTGLVAAVLAFLGSWSFFLFAYPYHLMRREQQNLFLFDGVHIRETYRGMGFLGRFVSDFLEQFFLAAVPASLIVALLLTGIGVVVFRICRHFLGKWPSLGIGALFFIWSFLRETGNLYLTRYTVATLALLSLVLLALQFKKAWLKPMAAVLLVGCGIWAFGSPVHKVYGKAWSVPQFKYERVLGLDTEACREHWDKVLQLSKVDLYTEEASYCYNLALAMKGRLGDDLFDHSQNHHYSLLFPASSDQTVMTNAMAGEAWFQLGDMTVAEQSAITSLQASPKHTGARYLVRLARVNLISGEDGAAMKYLTILRKTLFYGRWARSMMPGRQDEAVRVQLSDAHARLARKDIVHQLDRPREQLLGLLEADPTNAAARNYLLCYDLLTYDLDAFMQDFTPDMIKGRLYQEAVLLWLTLQGRLTPDEIARYGMDLSVSDRMNRFGLNPSAFKNTYWYYYLKAMNKQQ
ncbi:MAG: hypothetical protein IJK29_07980 [Bacteroidales bacterium]|nr:hypothetical protein [Bacteroidales bacterium]